MIITRWDKYMYYETEKIELKEKVTDVLVKEIESFLNTDVNDTIKITKK